MTDRINNADWTQFPLSHPTPYTLILLECSPKDILSCRATCTTWYTWFSSTSTFWSKYISSFTTGFAPNDYRLAKLLEVPVAGESDALSLSVKVHRAMKETESVMNHGTLMLLKAMEEKRVPVLAPPSVFIRLKVNHPTVTKIVKEVLDMYLGRILVDENTKLTKLYEVRKLVSSRNMLPQVQFSFIDFVKKKTETSVDTSDGLVLEGEDKLEEALRLSLEAAEVPGEKRKRTESEKHISKRKRLDSEIEGDDDAEDIKEKHNIETNSESIYGVKDTVNPEFPTILELLSIDQPLVEELLVNRRQIDTSLIVPQFDDFLNHPGLLASGKLLVGCDSDGKVASVRPQNFCLDEGARLGGFIEYPMSQRSGNRVEFWGGKDIRFRWPEFAKQLDKIDKREEEIKVERPKGSKLNLPVMVPSLSTKKTPEDGNGETAGPSTSSSSVPDLMKRLVARGVSVKRK